MKRSSPVLPILLAVVGACDPYSAQQGEFTAGPVDPSNFPAPYLGVGADTGPNGFRSGRGRFVEVGGYVNNNPAGYYSFPFTTAQLAPAADPLRLVDDGNAYSPVPVGLAYVFDPAPPNPFPPSQTCTAPPNYTYDPTREDMRLDEQSNIFTQLPIASERPGVASTFTYVPIVSEVAVSGAGLACQSLKSEKTLNRVLGNPPPSGNYLLWAIIDTASGVYRVNENPTAAYGSPGYVNGVGVQKYGWFGHYYLAYIDGGYIPTQPATVTEGGRTKQVLRMKTQRLYVPRLITPTVSCGSPSRKCSAGQVCVSNTCRACTATGAAACPTGQTCITATGTCSASGMPGAGYDVLQASRAGDNYSPVCEVWQYTATAGAPPIPRPVSQLPQSETDITALPGGMPAVTTDVSRFLYCPQVN